MKAKTANRAIFVYLLLVLGVCYLLGLMEIITNTGKFYQILGISFTFIPVIAALITKRITGERAKFPLSLKVWKNMKCWFLSAFLPGILIAVGTIVYYLVFTEQYSGIFQIGIRFGTDMEIAVKSPILLAIVCIVLGIFLSFVTIKTENCMYAAIIHGVINIIGELPVYLSVDLKNGLLGPNPTGLLTMLPLIIVAIPCFMQLRSKQN